MVHKDLRRWTRDPVQIFLWAALPLAIAALMKLAFGGGDSTIRVRLAIADQDQTLVSQLVRGAFSQGELAQTYETTIVDSVEAWRLAADGDVSAALFIPRGFMDGFLDGKTVKLALVKNPAETILPVVAEETLEFLADGGTALRRILGDPLDRIVAAARGGEAPGDSTVLGISRGIGGSLERAGGSLFPPVLAVREVVPVAEAAPSIDYFALFFPGVVIMAMLFIGQALASDLWEEHKLGTLRRLVVTQEEARAWIVAKTLAGVVVYFCVFEGLFLAGKHLLRIDLGSIHLASLYLAVAGFAFLAALEAIVVLGRTETGGSVLSSVLIMPLVLLGGSLFPLESMPAVLRAIGERTPNGMILGEVKAILFGQASFSGVVSSLALCLALGAIFIAFAERQARRRFVGE